MVERACGEHRWNISAVLSGGDTTIEATPELFTALKQVEERAKAKVSVNSGTTAENVARQSRAVVGRQR